MTRKDYNAIAAAIRATARDTDMTATMRDELAANMAFALAGSNPRFDRVRFIAACQPLTL
jgi:hypothetical protein